MIPTRVIARMVCVGTAMLAGCDRMPGAPKKAVPVVVGSPSWTQSTFDTNCRGCHSHGAEGAAIPLDDLGYWKVATDASVTAAISNGQGVSMPAYLSEHGGPLSASEVEALVKGMRTLFGKGQSGGEGGISATVVAGNSIAGEAVFEAACAACHGNNGSAGSVMDPMYLKLVSDQALWSAVVYGRAALGSPAWNQAMGSRPHGLTPTEVADVVSWIAASRTKTKNASDGE